MSEGNFIAYFVVALFPFISIVLFKTLDYSKAIIWTILLGFLFLPVKTGFDLPIGPFLDKFSIPALSAYFLVYLFTRERLEFFPESRLISFLLLVYIFSPLITGYLNQEPLVYGVKVLQGINYFSGEGVTAVMYRFFYVVPFLLGRQFLQSRQSLVDILTILALVGTAYTLIVLWEIRMSPRLHSIIYGYFPHDFQQQVRNGGFRSVAFIGHGLRTSMFLVVCLTAALYLAKNRIKLLNIAPIFVVFYLILVLFLNKSVAAFVYAIAATLFTFLLSAKKQKAVLFVLCLIVFVYPILRGSELFPDDYMVDLALNIDEARSQSLWFRFDNEDRLLEKAQQKPIFGWGLYGRNRVYDEVGNPLSVTDGEWIISFGINGWVGYIAYYGLLLIPVFRAVKASIMYGESRSEVMFLSCIVVLVIVNTLINSGIAPWVWLISGALLGSAESMRRKAMASQERRVEVS